MTEAPPLNGGDPSAILEWLVAQVAELREENGRIKTLLALHGANPEMRDALIEQFEAAATMWFDVRNSHAEVQRLHRECTSMHLTMKKMTDHAGWMR